MPTIEEMSLKEIEVLMSKLRVRRSQLKKTGKVAERKIMTLTHRRERLLEKVREIDGQIETLRKDAAITPASAPRRRGRRPKTAQIAV